MADRQGQILDAAVRVIAQDGVRGLRVEKVAAEAGVSTALIYYHFKDRAGVLRRALDHVTERAVRYTDDAFQAGAPRDRLERLLLLELQDDDEVRTNSIAWGELRASAVFLPELRDPLRDQTRSWCADVESLLVEAQNPSTPRKTTPANAAERLTALVESLSERWHSGTITLPRARELLREAINTELA